MRSVRVIVSARTRADGMGGILPANATAPARLTAERPAHAVAANAKAIRGAARRRDCKDISPFGRGAAAPPGLSRRHYRPASRNIRGGRWYLTGGSRDALEPGAVRRERRARQRDRVEI